MSAYYNEFDPKAAQWLRNLIAAGLIPAGDVDERSIEDVTPNDLRGFVQCHFFAGIGGWPLALALAGWPDSRPVWTGSCPCQPFSAAGKGAGFADERHLWPAWQHLIAQCRPAVVFGEQVASKAVDAWIDLVHADLEGMGYAFGGIAFPSAGVGAPHIRDRTFWVANAGSERLAQRIGDGRVQREALGAPAREAADGGSVVAGRMADTNGGDASAERQQRSGEQRQQPQDGGVVGMGYAIDESRQRNAGSILGAQAPQHGARIAVDGSLPVGFEHASAGMGERPGPTNGFWRAADWLGCTDGKWRPVEPGTFPLAHGATSRMGRLRAYGNAINAQAAQAFIESYCEARGLIDLAIAA